MSSEAIVLTDCDYQEKLERASGVLFVYKKQCPYCKALEKMLDKFFAGNPGINYLRIDSEESPAATKAVGVERVPTLCILKGGEVVARRVGLMNLKEMTEFFHSAWKRGLRCADLD